MVVVLMAIAVMDLGSKAGKVYFAIADESIDVGTICLNGHVDKCNKNCEHAGTKLCELAQQKPPRWWLKHFS